MHVFLTFLELRVWPALLSYIKPLGFLLLSSCGIISLKYVYPCNGKKRRRKERWPGIVEKWVVQRAFVLFNKIIYIVLLLTTQRSRWLQHSRRNPTAVIHPQSSILCCSCFSPIFSTYQRTIYYILLNLHFFLPYNFWGYQSTLAKKYFYEKKEKLKLTKQMKSERKERI